MKIFFLVLISLNCVGQVKVDRFISKKYDEIFKKMKIHHQQKAKELETNNSFDGITIFTKYRIDTLNKEDLVSENNNVYTFNLDSNKSIVEEFDENTLIPIFSKAKLLNDTLLVSIAIPFPPIFRHKILEGKVVSFYEEFDKYNSIFKINFSDSCQSHLSVPLLTKQFILNKKLYKKQELIYGKVAFETLPYYTKNDSFKNHFIIKKITGIYFFKVRIN